MRLQSLRESFRSGDVHLIRLVASFHQRRHSRFRRYSGGTGTACIQRFFAAATEGPTSGEYAEPRRFAVPCRRPSLPHETSRRNHQDRRRTTVRLDRSNVASEIGGFGPGAPTEARLRHGWPRTNPHRLHERLAPNIPLLPCLALIIPHRLYCSD